MTILITGGAGFMGSHMVRYLLQSRNDVEIINLDKLTYAGNLQNLSDLSGDPRYSFVHGDIADASVVDAICSKGVDVIINYAAETHVDRSIMDPKAFLLTDVIGTYTLLEAAKKFKVQRFIQISTDEVFGSIAEGEFTEHSAFEPNSPYSASKAGADHLCRAFGKTYDLPVIVTHSCNFFGPNQYPEKLIPLFITNLIEDKTVPLYGDGLNEREYVYAQDHCRAIGLLLTQGRDGEVYNIATGWRFTNKAITELLIKEFGVGADSIEYVKDRPGHDRRYALNGDKLHAMGWTPEKDFQARLHETVEWYRSHEQWWKPLKSGQHRAYFEQQYGR